MLRFTAPALISKHADLKFAYSPHARVTVKQQHIHAANVKHAND